MGIEQVIEEAPPAAEEGGEEKGDGEGEEGGDEAEGKGDGEGEGEGEGDGEGGEKEAEEPAPPPEPKYTNFAGELFTLLGACQRASVCCVSWRQLRGVMGCILVRVRADTNGSGVINVSDLLTMVNLITKGYGEAALKLYV